MTVIHWEYSRKKLSWDSIITNVSLFTGKYEAVKVKGLFFWVKKDSHQLSRWLQGQGLANQLLKHRFTWDCCMCLVLRVNIIYKVENQKWSCCVLTQTQPNEGWKYLMWHLLLMVKWVEWDEISPLDATKSYKLVLF